MAEATELQLEAVALAGTLSAQRRYGRPVAATSGAPGFGGMKAILLPAWALGLSDVGAGVHLSGAARPGRSNA